jgi:hypothetical protein
MILPKSCTHYTQQTRKLLIKQWYNIIFLILLSEGVNGAVQGAMSGKIVEGGASGAVDGAKTSINKLMN